MHSFSVWPCIFIALAAIDPPPRRFAPRAPVIDRIGAQAKMMTEVLRAARQSTSEAFNFASYIEADGYEPNNPCTWTGVECSDGAVRVFRMTGVHYLAEVYHKWEIDADWLPSTICELHLVDIVFINGLRTDLLPRELRYLSLSKCGDLQWRFRFDRLPKQMEFLSISQLDENFGPVFIGALPSTMKIIKIFAYRISSAIIDRHCLPEDLEKVVVCSAWGSTLVDIDGGHLDRRVSTKKEPHWLMREEHPHVKYIKQYHENFLEHQRQAYEGLLDGGKG